jgi:hypothetical protein
MLELIKTKVKFGGKSGVPITISHIDKNGKSKEIKLF